MKNNEKEYSNSISQALIDDTPKSGRIVLYIILGLLVVFFIWAYFTKVNELVRGEAKVIPYGQNKIVQNFDGGIIKEIVAEEGDLVQQGDVILRIENVQSASIYDKNVGEIDDLKLRQKRLYAEVNQIDFVIEKNDAISQKEYNLYLTNKEQFNSKIKVLEEQVQQKIKEKDEINSNVKYLQNSLSLISKEREMIKPLSEKGIVSQVEYLKLEREVNSIRDNLESAKLSLSRVSSMIKEAENRISEAKNEFINEAQKQYSDISSKLNSISKENNALEDQVKRTAIKAPVTGYIKKMFVNTIGGSVQPGMDLVEIVPSEDKLLIETKINPEDIAFLTPGLEVSIKFTAYDFTIYGSLKGTIEKISPDSTTEEDKTYYLIYVKSEQNYLKSKNKILNIIPGMRGSADIITGQKSILNYLLKPIIKTKQYAFSEK
jgi:adhesin transport system membrane fusion protein